ncbi:MAG: 50S ribosomal protein L24 [Pseudomonadota bacterium]
MTQLRFKIKKGDLVQVTTGKNKGLRGTVQKVLLSEARVIVEGINQVTRHIRPSQQNPSGSITKTLPIHISNVSVLDPSTDAPSKVGFKVNPDGTKIRIFKKSGQPV